LPVTPAGEVHPTSDSIGVLATALVNHELGTILAPEVVAWARRVGALVHLDAVQATTKLDLSSQTADSIAISSHKLGGPQGVGALITTADSGLPLVDAGHQERGRRPGTENVLGIIGFGAAAAAVELARWPAVAALGEVLEAALHAQGLIAGVTINGVDARRVGGTVNAWFAGALGQDVVMGLDLHGIAASTGAACTSGSVQPSTVLVGMGRTPDQAREAVRFSLGPTTTEDEIKQVLAVLPGIVERARQHR
jgi:cysteine desulfurase